MENEDYFYKGKIKPNAPIYGTSSGVSNKVDKIKSFDDLRNAKTAEKEIVLYNLFHNLNSSFREQYSRTFEQCQMLYSGNDVEFKEILAKLFNSSETIYDSFELNSIVKNIAAKIMQPFYSRDSLLTAIPTPETLDTYEKIEVLLNEQLKETKTSTEVYKVVKDALIYGIGYAIIGWSVETKTVPKTVLTVYNSINKETGEEVQDTVESEETEEITIENPDIAAVRVSDIMYPQAARWKDIPYCIRLERVSQRTFAERYGSQKETKGMELNELNLLGTTVSRFKNYFDQLVERIPGQESSVGNGAIDEITIAHFYLKDESYYVLALEMNQEKTFVGAKLVYEGSSPVPGMAIPVIPYIPEPSSQRIIGESLVLVAKNDARKVMELDNIILRDSRTTAGANFLYGAGAMLDKVAYMNRPPNTPFEIEGDISQIVPNNLDAFKPEIANVRGLFKGTLDSVTGVTDFFSGNIGRSARLSGVDSLLANALSRLAPAINHLSSFVNDVSDAYLLLNRAFLPKRFVELKSSIYASEPIERHQIPYPVKFNIKTSITSGAEKEIMLAGLNKAVEIAIGQEQVQPGSWDIQGLLAHFLSESGSPQIKKFMIKTPLTKQEQMNLLQIDKVQRLQANSSLPNNEDPMGNQLQEPGITQRGQTGGTSPENIKMSGMTENNPL